MQGTTHVALGVVLGCCCRTGRVEVGGEQGAGCQVPLRADCRGRGSGPVVADPSLTGFVLPLLSSSAPGSALDPYSPCNKDCECQTDSFTPVCGADGVTYLSACFAGCNSTVLGIFCWGGWGRGFGQPRQCKSQAQEWEATCVPCFVLLHCDFLGLCPALVEGPPSAGWGHCRAIQPFFLIKYISKKRH